MCEMCERTPTCPFLQSPFCIPFVEASGDAHPLMFKMDDDVRQDALVLQFAKVCGSPLCVRVFVWYLSGCVASVRALMCVDHCR